MNNAEQTILPIINLRYDLPVLEGPADEDREPGDAKTAVGNDLVPLLKETLKWTKGAVFLLAIIAGVALFLRWS